MTSKLTATQTGNSKMADTQPSYWHSPQEHTKPKSVVGKVTKTCSLPIKQVVSSISEMARSVSQRLFNKRSRQDRSPSPDDSAIWSDEEWEEAPLMPHKREQRLDEELRECDSQLRSRSTDQQLHTYRDLLKAGKAAISTLESRIRDIKADKDQLSQLQQDRASTGGKNRRARGKHQPPHVASGTCEESHYPLARSMSGRCTT